MLIDFYILITISSFSLESSKLNKAIDALYFNFAIIHLFF